MNKNVGGSAWESNPPGTVLAPHTGFEVRELHQTAAHFHKPLKTNLVFIGTKLFEKTIDCNLLDSGSSEFGLYIITIVFFVNIYTAFHNNVQNYAITELRHKRGYGCRKKTFEYRNVFLTTTISLTTQLKI